jgi:ankyrin repeat protein/ElaB/YqjD/DUF883 family membrane-anchored ribosome-binding protein
MSTREKRRNPNPVSSPCKPKKGKAANDDEDTTEADDVFSTQHLELQRLLSAMERDENPAKSPWQSIGMRAERAQTLWKNIAPRVNGKEHSKMEARVQRLCQRALEISNERAKDTPENPVQKIFLNGNSTANATKKLTSSRKQEPGVEQPIYEQETDTKRKGIVNKPKNDKGNVAVPPPSVQDLQKTQRDQMESAISQMAAQMKNETSRIHSTLQQQTVGVLAEMEDAAADNVQQVTEVAKAVKGHVAKNWTRSIGTWTMLFAIAGAFVFCLVAIQVAPKRKGACLFFCKAEHEQFCRTLPDGTKECIKDPSVAENGKETTDHECQLDMNGECLPTPDDIMKEYLETVYASERTDANMQENDYQPAKDMDVLDEIKFPVGGLAEELVMQEYMESVETTENTRKQAGEAVVLSQTDDDDVDTAESPMLNGQPFSPSDVREAASKGDAVLVEKYLQIMPEYIDMVDDNQWTCLHYAVRSEHDELVRMLLAFGADATLTTSEGKTALDNAIMQYGLNHPITCRLKGQVHEGKPFSSSDFRTAAELGYLDLVNDYLRVKPDIVNEADGNRWTALHLAARGGRTEIVRRLVNMGADIRLKTNAAKDSLEIALERLEQNHPVVEILKNAAASYSESENAVNGGYMDERMEGEGAVVSMFQAAAFGDVERLKRSLQKLPHMKDSVDDNGWTSLHIAASNGRVEAAVALLEAGCDPWIENRDGETAFDVALDEYGEKHRVSLVLNEAQNLDMRDMHAFLEAVDRGDAETVRSYATAKSYFRRHKIAADALRRAVNHNQVEVIRVLLEAEWEPSEKRHDGRSVYDLALELYEEGHAILELLEQHGV